MSIPNLLSFLFNGSLSAAIACLAICALIRFRRDSMPQLHCFLWGLVLLRLVIPPSLTPNLFPVHFFEQPSFKMSEEWPIPEFSTATHPLAETQVTASSPKRIWNSLFAIWLIGSSMLTIGWFKRRARYRRVIRESRVLGDDWARELCERWRTALGIRRNVRIVVGEDSRTGPFTLGLVRPVIYFPEKTVQSVSCFEAVLAHELTHILYWDDLKIGLQSLIGIAYFFHPVAWFSSRKLNHARERARDLRVLSTGLLTARAYGKGLIEAVQAPTQAIGVAALGGSLPSRIRAIAQCPAKVTARPRHSVIVLSIAIVFLCGVRGHQAEPFSSPASTQPAKMIEWSTPVPSARVSSGFGPRVNPFNHERESHRGIDLVGAKGIAILAPAAGTVIIATNRDPNRPNYGRLVEIDHGHGVRSLLAHLGSVTVNHGDRINRGATIGTMGISGKSTGVHVHFAVFVEGQAQDPVLWVSELGAPKN